MMIVLVIIAALFLFGVISGAAFLQWIAVLIVAPVVLFVLYLIIAGAQNSGQAPLRTHGDARPRKPAKPSSSSTD